MGSELVVVRHGQSTWNVDHRFTGQADPPLSDLGREQAVALALGCAGERFDAVVTSDLVRAFETGSIVAGRLGRPDPVRVPELRERWNRTLTGLARDRIEADYPEQLAAWREARPITVPGAHEPFDGFVDRVSRGLLVAARHGDRVLVVAHAGVFVALGALAGGASTTEVANAEGRRVAVHDDGTIEVGGSFHLAPGTTRTGECDP